MKFPDILSERVEFIKERIASRGEQLNSSGVPLKEVMLQTALLAYQQKANEELCIAAFLHNFGELFSNHVFDCTELNDILPYIYLQVGLSEKTKKSAIIAHNLGFSKNIVQLIASQSASFLYLCHEHPSYSLGFAHKQHSIYALDEELLMELEQAPLFKEAVLLRRWIDQGKISGLHSSENQYFIYLIAQHLSSLELVS